MTFLDLIYAHNRVVAFGASTCFGLGDVDGGGIVERLRLEHMATPKKVMYNLGLEYGANIKSNLKTLKQEVSRRRPDFLIFIPGANDAVRLGAAQAAPNIPLLDYKEFLDELHNTALDIVESYMVIGQHPILESKTNPADVGPIRKNNKNVSANFLLYDVLEYERATKEFFTSHEVPYLDIMSLFLPLDHSEYLHQDGLHLSSLGVEKVLEHLKSSNISHENNR